MLALSLVPLCSLASYPSLFDSLFKTYSEAYLPTDWRLLKAQCYQESRLDNWAMSPVGAQGLCQFMPATWRDMQKQLGTDAGAFNPMLNIRAGALYMRRLRRSWHSPRPERDRHSLALASYNAGLGNLLKAQRRCDMATLWPEIADCLEQVTGEHSRETLQYVSAIWRFYRDMRGD